MRTASFMSFALLVLGALIVVVAASAAANPPDTDNPPTTDWFFDSGGNVTIMGKTWDVNYNITVANDTHLKFDRCTFTIYDPYVLNYLWIQVWWNGSLTLTDCDFKTKMDSGYFIYVQNETVFERTKLTGLVAAYTRGGISAYGCTLTFTETQISDVVDAPAVWAENCNIIATDLEVTNSGGSGTDEAPFMAVYTYNSYDDEFVLKCTDCRFSDNPSRGFGLRAYMNWADIMATFTDCVFEDNERRGLDIYWGRDGYFDNTNASLDLMVTGCEFTSNTHDGFRFNQYDVRREGMSYVNITLKQCMFSSGEGSGAFINVYYGDQMYNIVIDECDFADNAIGGRAGLALSNRYMYSTWNATITNCTFLDNDYTGLHIEHRSSTVDGGKYIIRDCTFKNQTQDFYIYNYRHGDYYNDFWIEDCQFSGSEDAGIYHYIGWSQLPIELHVYNCQFSDAEGSGMASSSSGDESDGVWWDIQDCTFTDLGDEAIRFTLSFPMSGAILEITDCTMDNTGGIDFKVTNNVDIAQAMHVLRMLRTTVTNSTDTAVEAVVYGYYGVGLTVDFETVHLADAMFNGLKAFASSNYASATRSIDMDIMLANTTVHIISGNGLDLGTDRTDYKGTRTVEIDNLTILNTLRAVTFSGVNGNLVRTTLSSSFKHDVVVVSSDVELWEIDIDSLDADKFQVIESGSIKFWYRMSISVEWNTGGLVDKAVVKVMDNHQTLIGAYTQVGGSSLPDLVLNSFQIRETGLFTRSPYSLDVTLKNINKGASVALDMNKDVTVTLSDQVPPSIYINDPATGIVQQSRVIKVFGSSFDGESDVDLVEVSLNGTTWYQTADTTSWEYTFTLTLDDVKDAGGVFTIRARASDLAGNMASTLVVVSIDPFPPQLILDFPPDIVGGYQTNDAMLNVRGITEQDATVLVNGVDVTVGGTLFSTKIQLVEGPNTISISASDALGNIITIKRVVHLDTKAPYIVLLSPEEGEMFISDTIEVSGQAEDGLTITIGTYTLTIDEYDNGAFSYDLPLTRGMNTVTINAMDAAGNVAAIERMVHLDDVPPMLAINGPADDSSQKDFEIVVIGTTDPDSMLLINDELVVLDHGLFNHMLVGIVGENPITVIATDAAGNEVRVDLTVTIDVDSPQLNPGPSLDTVKTAQYTLAGTAPGASKVLINSEPYPVVADAFSVDVILLEGTNRFTITAVDAAGNSVTKSRSVVLDTKAPILILRIVGAEQDETGEWIYTTLKGDLAVMTVTGYTDDAVKILVNDQLVPISEGGYFEYVYTLNVNALNKVNVTAFDSANNEVSITRDVTHETITPEEENTFEWGWVILAVGLVILLVAVLVGYRMVTAGEPAVESLHVEEEEVLAPITLEDELDEDIEADLDEDLEADLDDLEDDEDLKDELDEDLEDEDLVVGEEDEEEVHELTAPERPKTGGSRPVTVTAASEGIPEEEDKDLQDQGAEADIGADESDQEGI